MDKKIKPKPHSIQGLGWASLAGQTYFDGSNTNMEEDFINKRNIIYKSNLTKINKNSNI